MQNRILLGITGSVAAIKTLELTKLLLKTSEVKIVATKNAFYFIEKQLEQFKKLGVDVYLDEHQWDKDYQLGDEILHIELRRWANCLIIAPLDANTLAKLTNGICDNLLTDIYRAWDRFTYPVIVAPSMNSFMWTNEPTDAQINNLMSKHGVFVLSPIYKKLACGDTGIGAMADIEYISQYVYDKLKWEFPLKECSGIPLNHHPGAFGFQRKNNHHTGVDLYCKNGSIVHAVEQGTVVKYDIFTGPKLGHDWWEETWGLMVEGRSGVINYGEVSVLNKNGFNEFNIHVGTQVKKGQPIAAVKRVLFEDRLRPDIPGHSTSMLHLELYKHGYREFADWHDLAKNPNLLDPTPYLICANPTFKTLTWDNSEGKKVG